jgi:murein DD-endopeptidase MepM/ murein hydrolase activator NlpD
VLVGLATRWSGDTRGPAAASVADRVIATSPVQAPEPVSPIPSGPVTQVAGTIVDGSGHPITGVHVRILGVFGDTDPSGGFRIAAPAADKYTVLLDAPHVFPAEVTWRAGDPPPRILLARRARLSARVTANGAAVPGAEVSISDGSRPTLATATTDREGIARFDDLLPGPYELWARRDSAVSALVRVGDIGGDAQPDVPLELAPGTRVQGQLVVDDKLPAGATITLAPIDVDHAVRVATLDDRGHFAIDGVPHGRWRVEGAVAGYVQSGESIAEARGPREDATVRMMRAGAVSGTAIDSAGTPVANATIVLRQQGVQAALVDDRPRVTASARLRWVHPLAGHRMLPGGEFLKFGATRSGVRPAECGGGHCGVDIGSARGTIIHAAADGEISLAFTEIRGEAGRYVAIDHGDGLRTFYMHLDELRGGLEIGQKVRAGEPLGKMGATGAASGPHLHFAITQERGGRTWYIDPEPVLRHAVVLPAARAFDPIDAGKPTVIAAVRWGEVGRAVPAAAPQSFTTDTKGRFRIDGVAPGTYVAVAFAAELAPETSATFAVRTGGETGDIAIAMRPGVLVHGRVLGRDGPLAGATIIASAGTGENAHDVATTYATAQGEYTLRALSGQLVLSATAPGYGVIDRPLVLEGNTANKPRRREDFTLVIENAQLRGQVLAPDGGPAGSVTLRVVDGPTRRHAVTDATGRFTIDRVATGSYTLEVVSADYPLARIPMQSDRWVDVHLDRGGSMRCELRDARSAAPVANVRIEASGPNNQTASAVTDARGIAELRALPIGEWNVRARAKGFIEARQAVTVRASTVPQEIRIDLALGVTLGGVVRDRYGHRVAGARVWTDGVTTQSDADGNFRLADAPAGSHWIEAELEGAHGAVQLQLSPGDERMTLAIELTR